ncbi:MAG: transcriptional repressor [Firmicutes bacterium]|nr:transcriptional repressor [Bacillota bacterium]
MATYRTQQKTDLIDFLKCHAERAFTIDEIVEKMKADPAFENAPGKSTVYRLMSKLVEEGTVTCFSKGGGVKATYQIIGGEHCHHHMHMKCTGCGRLIHMSDEESEKLLERIHALSHFDIDLSQTLLYGRCEGCGTDGKGRHI